MSGNPSYAHRMTYLIQLGTQQKHASLIFNQFFSLNVHSSDVFLSKIFSFFLYLICVVSHHFFSCFISNFQSFA